MKTIVIIAIFCFAGLQINAQQKIRIFNTVLSSKDINGTDNFNVKNFAETSKVIKDPLTSNRLNYFVGKMYNDGNLRNLLTFFDLSTETANYTYLDSIDMDYYSGVSFRHYLKPIYGNEQNYQQLKKAFDKAKSVKEKKDLLIIDDYSTYFDALNNSKYLIDSASFKNQDTIERVVKAGIKANLDSIIFKKSVSGKVGINFALDNLVDKGVTVTGTYYTIAYNADYLSKVYNYLVQKYKPNISNIKKIVDQDQFTSTLIKYWNGKDDVALIAGSAVLKLQITYNLKKINADTISAIVNANVKIPFADAAKLTAEIYGGLNVKKTGTDSSTTVNYYCVSYAYFQKLENDFQGDH